MRARHATGAAAAAAGALALWTYVALYPPLPADLGGAADLDARAEHVRFAVAPGDSLDGWLLPGRRPELLVLLHGYGRTHKRMWRYGQFLAEAGYGVFAYDARSSRAGRRLPTTLGAYERSDARAALRYLRSRPDIAPLAIGLYGESLGGSVALAVAAEDTAVRVVIGDSAFTDGVAALRDALRMLAPPLGALTPAARAWSRLTSGVDPGALDARAAMPALRGRPVLLIHGGRDRRLPARHARELWQAAGATHRLWIVPASGHAQAWRLDPDGYRRVVLQFLEQSRPGSRPPA